MRPDQFGQMAHMSQPLAVALANVPLFQSRGPTANVTAALAEVTGISTLALDLAQLRISRSGDLTALRELLRDPSVHKTDGLQYQISIKQRLLSRPGRVAMPGKVKQRVTLAFASPKGQVLIRLTVMFDQRPGASSAAAGVKQLARICLSYKFETAAGHNSLRHELVVAGKGPHANRAHAA